jgi:hypothetical protein
MPPPHGTVEEARSYSGTGNGRDRHPPARPTYVAPPRGGGADVIPVPPSKWDPGVGGTQHIPKTTRDGILSVPNIKKAQTGVDLYTLYNWVKTGNPYSRTLHGINALLNRLRQRPNVSKIDFNVDDLNLEELTEQDWEAQLRAQIEALQNRQTENIPRKDVWNVKRPVTLTGAGGTRTVDWGGPLDEYTSDIDLNKAYRELMNKVMGKTYSETDIIPPDRFPFEDPYGNREKYKLENMLKTLPYSGYRKVTDIPLRMDVAQGGVANLFYGGMV